MGVLSIMLKLQQCQETASAALARHSKSRHDHGLFSWNSIGTVYAEASKFLPCQCQPDTSATAALGFKEIVGHMSSDQNPEVPRSLGAVSSLLRDGADGYSTF